MKDFKITLMGWVLVSLTLIGILPFAITAYQIHSGREGLVEQVQQTHLISVLATSDRIGSYFELLNSIASSAAKNPNLYTQADSTSAQEILIGILRARNDIVAASVIQQIDGEINLIQSAQSKEYRDAAKQAFKLQANEVFQLVTANKQTWLLITQPLEDSDLHLRLLAKPQAFETILQPREMEGAVLGVFKRTGEKIAGTLDSITDFPESFRELVATKKFKSSAANFNFSDGSRAVASFSEVPFTDWIVVSRQPALKAELATQQYLKQAFYAFISVLLMGLAFAFAAKKKVITPIRELIDAQQRLAGIDLNTVQGSEIEQLKLGFARLEQNVSARKELDKTFLGRYQVVELIASGAMGTVFKGYDPRLERDVALKTIKIGKLSGDFNRSELAKQLVLEAKLVAKVPHQNIVSVYDAVDAGESALVAMEYIHGMSLADYLTSHGRIDHTQVIALAIGMLRGLAAAHNASIIHRDIKPGNILLGYDGEIKLTDFGIADFISQFEENTDGTIIGTPGYVAPELLKGGTYSIASDLFAIGVLLYRCTTGNNPFRGKNLPKIFQETLTFNPPSPRELDENIPTPLSNAIMYLLQKNPNNRPKNADLLADILQKEFASVKWSAPKNTAIK